MRHIVIVGKPSISEKASGAKDTYLYSLYTGIKSEEIENAKLKDLIPKIKNVAWGGSLIQVFIFSEEEIPCQMLTELIDAISVNPHMRIAYIENGTKFGWPAWIQQGLLKEFGK